MAAEILIAEDDPQIAKLIAFKLSHLGFSASIASNGRIAIEMLMAKNSWSLLILDIMMPIMNGWEVLKELKNNSHLYVPILMLTARNLQTQERLTASNYGVKGIIRKPFDPMALASEVTKMVVTK